MNRELIDVFKALISTIEAISGADKQSISNIIDTSVPFLDANDSVRLATVLDRCAEIIKHEDNPQLLVKSSGSIYACFLFSYATSIQAKLTEFSNRNDIALTRIYQSLSKDKEYLFEDAQNISTTLDMLNFYSNKIQDSASKAIKIILGEDNE